MTGPQYEGVTLAGRLAQGPIEPGKALDILEQVLESLAVAHDAGVMHGAISPDNVILTPDGQATLVGFPALGAGALPPVKPPKGATNPAYLAPEQIMDDPVGRRADIYAVGVLAYAMLTGRDPFGASDGIATDNVFYRILYRPTPHVPDALLVGLPVGVGPAIERAMAKEPQGRFQDARSFLAALESQTALVPAPVAPVEKGPRPKWMIYALTGGAAVIVLLAIGLGVAYGLGGKTPTTTVAEDTTASTSTIPSTTTLAAVVDDSSTTTVAPSTSDTGLPSTTLDTSSTSSSTSATTTTTGLSTTTTRRTTTTTARSTTTTTLKTATLTVNNTTVVYTGAAKHPSFTTNVSSPHVTYSSSPVNAGGPYSITVTISAPGYKSVSKAGNLTISKDTAIISVSGGTYDYDGSSHGLHLNSAVGAHSGANLSGMVTLGGSYTDPGSYLITWTFNGGTNYVSDSRQVLLTINEPPTTTTTAAP